MNDPLLEAMNRAAEEMTPEDIDKVIAYLRKGHESFVKGEKPSAKAKAASAGDILKDLGLKGVVVGPQVLGLKRRI